MMEMTGKRINKVRKSKEGSLKKSKDKRMKLNRRQIEYKRKLK